MPFSKQQFDPALMESLRAAFRKVCDALDMKCEAEDPMTDIIVGKIVALAKAGEADADTLAEKVLTDLASRP
jgi:hypothetical protein